MTPSIEHLDWLLLAFWGIFLFIASYILIVVSNYLTGDRPGTLLNAVFIVLLTMFVMRIAFDVSSYFFMLLLQDPVVGITLPPGYTFIDWVREPLALKWRVMGIVPMIRYIPFGIAFMVGGILQIFLWQVTFPIAMLVLIAQIILNLVALVVLSLIFQVGNNLILHYQAQSAQRQEYGDAKVPPRDLPHMAHRVQNYEPANPTLGHKIRNAWSSFNQHLSGFYAALDPISRHLPVPIRHLLDAGGWLLVLPGLGGIGWWAFRRHAALAKAAPEKAKPINPRDVPII